MIEFGVDMAYCEECGDLDLVVLNDENGEMDSREFVPRATANDVEDMARENESLRELVKVLWHLLHDWLLKSGEVPYGELDAAYESMKKLGIEVDE